jgi:hypothetical protein
MDVKPQPITLFADKSRSEIGLVTGGLRITMTGVEALELWTELGDMLRALCGARPENLAPSAASLLREPSARSEPTDDGARRAGLVERTLGKLTGL